MKKIKNLSMFVLLAILLSSVTFAQDHTKTVSKRQYLHDQDAAKSEPRHYSSFSDRSINNVKGAKGWTLEFQYDVETLSGEGDCAGAESDGSYIYVSDWVSDTLLKFDMAGNFVEHFTIPGVGYLRDMAYDGQYFYGSDASNYIWKMDFDNKQLVDTIPSPAPVRSIAYDSVNDAFWINNWSENLQLLTRTGVTIDSIASPPSMYGSAYDGKSPGGPFLWIFTGTNNFSSGCQIERYHIPTEQLYGVPHSVSDDLGPGIAGGLFMFDDTATGNTILGGLIQADTDICFGYGLLSTAPDTCDVGVVKVLSPVSGFNLTNSEIVEIEIQNFGLNPQSGFDVSYVINGGATVTETINDTIDMFMTTKHIFTIPADLSNVGSYKITAYTSLPCDNYLTNDTIHESVVHVEPADFDAYCYVVDGATVGPSKFNIQSPGTIINLEDQSALDLVFNGVWGPGNRWFGLTYGPTPELITFDTLTGARSVIGAADPTTPDELWFGLTYDYSSSTMYALAWSAVKETSLYTIDILTGASSEICPCSGVKVGLACNLAGDLYAIDLDNAELCSIDKITGASTSIGWVGFTSWGVPDLEFDHYSNRLFMAAYLYPENSGQLRLVDVTTGETINLGEFDQNSSLSALAIPYYGGVGVDELVKEFSYNVYPNPAYDFITVKCTNLISEYTIINYIGQVVIQNSVNTDHFNVDVRSFSTGMYFIQLVTENGVVTEKISVE